MTNIDNEKLNDIETWEDLLKLVIEKAMIKTHVAMLAFVESIGEWNGKYGIMTVKPFPLEKGQGEYTLQVYYFNENKELYLDKNDVKEREKYKKGDICKVLFTDFDFRNNLKETKPKETSNSSNHDYSFGILL